MMVSFPTLKSNFGWKANIQFLLPVLRVLCISLGLTLSRYHIPERNANRIRPIQPSYHQTPHSHHPYSTVGPHDLFHVPDIICGLGLEADGASAPLCCFRHWVHHVQQFSGFRKGLSSGAGGVAVVFVETVNETRQSPTEQLQPPSQLILTWDDPGRSVIVWKKDQRRRDWMAAEKQSLVLPI